MFSLHATSSDFQARPRDDASGAAALSSTDEAAAVVAGYRALQADKELHRHKPGSAARVRRMAAVLMPVAAAWGISTHELIVAIGRGIE